MCKIIKVVKSCNSENYGKLRATFKGRSNVLGGSPINWVWLCILLNHGPCMRRAYKLRMGRHDRFDKPKN